MKAKRSKISQEDAKPKDDFLPYQKKKIFPIKTKFGNNVGLGSVKIDKRRREVLTRLTFTQSQGFELSLKGLLEPLKHSKAITDLRFKFDRLMEEELKILEEGVYMKRLSLSSISISISQEISLRFLMKLMNFIGKFSSLQKISLSSLKLQLATSWNSWTSTREDYRDMQNKNSYTCRNLGTTLKRFPNLKSLHLDIPSDREETKTKFMDGLIPYLHKKNRLEALGLTLIRDPLTRDTEITDKDFKRFLGALEQLQSLKTFRFYLGPSKDTPNMTDSRMKKLCSQMKKFQNLQILDINFPESSVSNIGITPFAACLKHFPLLHTLNLNFYASSSITAECLKTLSSGFVKIPHLCNLRFDLSGCTVTGNGDALITNLSKGLASLTGLTSFSLRLYNRNPSLKDEGLIHLGKSLQKLELLKSLSLVIPECEQVTSKGVIEISRGIEKLPFLQNLELTLAESQKITGEELISVLQAVSCNQSLKDVALDFAKCDITDQDLQALPSIFKKLHFLQKFALSLDRCTELTDLGFVALCKSLPHLISLRHLQLSFSSCSQITPDAILGLKDIFVKLPLLKTIDLQTPTYCPPQVV